jgi:hypothetical protein
MGKFELVRRPRHKIWMKRKDYKEQL